jgi:hypothetical protein
MISFTNVVINIRKSISYSPSENKSILNKNEKNP